MALATHPGAVRLLWEVCQIPDFRKVMSDSHTRLLAHCFLHLAGPDERLPIPWIAGQMANLDRIDGDIDTLDGAHRACPDLDLHHPPRRLGRGCRGMAGARPRHRGSAVRRACTTSITQRFVDRRSAFLVRQLAADGELLAAVVERRRGPGRGRLCRPARRVALCSRRGRRRRDADADRRRQPGAARRGGRPGAPARRRPRRRLSPSTRRGCCAGAAGWSAGWRRARRC